MAIQWINKFSTVDQYGNTLYSNMGIDFNESDVSDTKYQIQPKLYRRDAFSTQNLDIVESYYIDAMPDGYRKEYSSMRLFVNGSSGPSGSEMKFANNSSMFESPLVYEKKDEPYTVRIVMWTSFWWTWGPNGASAKDVSSAIAADPYMVWEIAIPAAGAPPTPTSVKHVRDSDSQNTVSWSVRDAADLTAIYVYKDKGDTGRYAKAATLPATATSYADTDVGIDMSYSYKVAAYNGVNESMSLPTELTYNTPSAPRSVSVSRSANGMAVVTMDNTSKIANGTQIQFKKGANGAWIEWYEAAEKLTRRDGPIEDSLLPIYFRARNKASYGGLVLASGWTESANPLPANDKPLPPIVVDPFNGAVVVNSDTVMFRAVHNSRTGLPLGGYKARIVLRGEDGSVWEDAEHEYPATSTDGTFGAGISYRPMPDGGTITAYLASKDEGGSGYSDYAVVTVTLASAPSVRIESSQLVYKQSPDDPMFEMELQSLPMTVKMANSRNRRIVSFDLVVEELDYEWREVVENGQTVSKVFFYTVATPLRRSYTGDTATISADELVGGAYYRITANVVDANGISGSYSTGFVKSIPEPGAPRVEASATDDDGVSVTAYYQSGRTPKASDATKYAIYRKELPEGVNSEDGGFEQMYGAGYSLIASGIPIGSAYVDRTAPLNTDMFYRVVYYNDQGGSSSSVKLATIVSSRWWFHWPDGTAKAVFDPAGSYDVTRPAKEIISHGGRKKPVRYDGLSVSLVESVSFTCIEKAEAFDFIKMVEESGECFYRSGDGRCYMADVECSISPEYTKRGMYGTVTAKLTRIDGEPRWL